MRSAIRAWDAILADRSRCDAGVARHDMCIGVARPWGLPAKPRRTWLSTGYTYLKHTHFEFVRVEGSDIQTHESKSKNFCSIDERGKENRWRAST
jgi:hypothetical protein